MKSDAFNKALLCLTISSLLLPSGVQAATITTGELDLGYQTRDVSSNESKFEEYGEVPQGAVIPHIQADILRSSDSVHFEGNNIRQNNQSFDLNYNRNYKMDVDASWDQTPHNYSNNGRTLYNQDSPGHLTLPSGLKGAFPQGSAPTTSAFNTTYSSFTSGAHDADLNKQDNKGAIKLGFKTGEHMRYNIGFTQDQIEGNKPGSYALGSSYPIQMPVPIDWKVYNINAGTQYASKDAQLGLNYMMSAFNNNIDTLIWDNPRRLTNSPTLGAAQGQTALAPDNWSQTVMLNGGVNLPAKTRFTAKGSMGYMRQNQALLPFTTNTSISAVNVSTNAVPEQTANAMMLTWMQDYALTNRVVKPVTLGVHFHSYQLVNRTSEVIFPGRSSFDNSFTAAQAMNERFEYRKDTLEGSADYQVINPWAVGFRYATEWDHRTDRETTNTTENTLTATTDIKPASSALLRGSYVRAHRKPQDFNGEGIFEETIEGAPNTFEEPPGLRRFDTSERTRDQGKVLLQWNPGPVMFELNGSLTHDKFGQGAGDLLEGTTQQAQMYGLLDNRDATAGGDIGWDVNTRLTFDVYYQYEETKGVQRSNRAGTASGNIQNSVMDWSVRSTDRYHLTGISAHIGKPVDPVGVRLAYDVTMSRGANNFIDPGTSITPASVTGVTLTPGVLKSPPDTKYMKQDVSAKADWRLTDQLTLAFGYLFEKYDVSNWQYQNNPLIGGTAANQTNIFLGANLQNYVAHVGSVVAKYKF